MSACWVLECKVSRGLHEKCSTYYSEARYAHIERAPFGREEVPCPGRRPLHTLRNSCAFVFVCSLVHSRSKSLRPGFMAKTKVWA